MAKKRKLSDAFRSFHSDQFATEVSNPTGVRVTAVSPALLIAKVNDPTQTLRVEQPGKIPPYWQPDKGSFNYSLNVLVNTRIDPLVSVQFFGLKVPGLTEPADVVMTGNALWENMGRDPITTEYYVNE